MSAANTKVCRRCGVEKTPLHFAVDKSQKDGLQTWCKGCRREYNRQWHKNNRAYRSESNRQWYRANREYRREYRRRWYENHAEYSREYVRQWRENNPERVDEYRKQWKENNRSLVRESIAARQAAKIQRTPPWADRGAIRAVYYEAQRANEVFGVEHHVDHIYPLQGNTVSGLHVAENLRVVTAEENLRKNNLTLEELTLREIFT